MRSVLVSIALAGCFPTDECTPTDSELARCETDHQLRACVYDAANERYLSIDSTCDAPYSCKDDGAGARCTGDPEPYPACAGANAFGVACDGDVLVRCENGNRVGHELCNSCGPLAGSDSLQCDGQLWSFCETDADCVTGAECHEVPNTFNKRCLLRCDCPELEECAGCREVSTEQAQCHRFTTSDGVDASFCI